MKPTDFLKVKRKIIIPLNIFHRYEPTLPPKKVLKLSILGQKPQCYATPAPEVEFIMEIKLAA